MRFILFCGLFALASLSCKTEFTDPEGVCEPEVFFEEAGALAPNDRNPIEVVDSWLTYTCAGFPTNTLGLGATCEAHADCGGPDQLCIQGLLPCDDPEVGRCTQSCRSDYECGRNLIETDAVPELICGMAQDQLSLCLPSECLAEIPGWDTICGPLGGEPVNALGVGLSCTSDSDCMTGTFCPGEGSAERYCTLLCEQDSDCGEMAACVCVEDETCMEQFFVCAPTEGCADAVRHHHCRGPGVPPREHGAICGDHNHE